jgi:hypothetical protein
MTSNEQLFLLFLFIVLVTILWLNPKSNIKTGGSGDFSSSSNSKKNIFSINDDFPRKVPRKN